MTECDWKGLGLRVPGVSVGRVPRELEVGQAHVFNHDLIGSDVGRRLKIRHATRTTRATGGINSSRSDEVVLIDTISADPQAADEHAISIKWQASGEEDDAAHVAGGVRSLGTRVCRVVLI